MQQKISTPSVVSILDTVIRSSQAFAYPEVGGIAPLDPWNTVLSKLEPYALEPDTFVAGLRNALTGPNATNPFVTVAKYENRFEMRAFKLVGPVGSGADFEGSTHQVFEDALASLPPEGGWLVVLPGTYTFSETVSIGSHIRLLGVHPQITTLTTSGNFPILSLGVGSLVDRFSLSGTAITDQPLVILAGEESTLQRCSLTDIARLGVSLVGARSQVLLSKFSTSDTSATTVAVSLQGVQQTVEACEFHGPFKGAAAQFESREGSLSKSFFSETLEGPAYKISSISLTDNKIIFNHFASATSLSQAVDKGTSTLRYGNTPNTLTANVNNALNPLKSFTGQPLVTSTDMVLSNQFTHTPSLAKSASSLWEKLDLFEQNMFEERNFFLSCDDPVYDSEGRPSSGVFSWNGATNTLTYPTFSLRSIHRTDPIATFSAGSLVVPANYCAVILVSGSSATLVAMTRSLVLGPTTSDRKVLLYALSSSGKALWLDGKRLLPGNATTTFDINGSLLPIGRYLGMTEGRNPAPLFYGFASHKEANLTKKVADHTALLQRLYERTNLQYQTETPESRISTEPAIGSWYDSSALLNGVPSVPTHLINHQGTLYGLVPTSGLYYFDRPAKGWRLVQGNPAGNGPFTSMTRLGTGLALLKSDGQVLSYSMSSGWGTLQTPTLRDSVSLPLVTTVPSSSSFYEAGQVDFSLQTQNYSLFTTVDGKSIRYYQDDNYIDAVAPRVFTEAAGDRGLLSHHPKDTGFNVTLDPETLSMDGDNGGFLQRSGLPLSKFFHGELLVPPRTNRESVLRLDWSSMRVENFAFCQPNGAFITVAHDATKTTFYVLCGGPGTVRLAAVLSSTDFGNFTPHSWVLDPYRQAVYILGASSTQEFIAYHGSWTSSSDSGGWGAGTFSFTKRTVSPGGSCSGVIANLDLYNDTMGSRDVVALVSDVGRSNRPTWWRYSVVSDAWTKVTLTDQSPSAATDFQVTWATAGSFLYNPASDAMAGHGAASPTGFQFLVRSNARSGRPTLFRWLRLTNTFDSAALGLPDGLTLSGAEASGLTQSLGAVYHPTFKAVMWLVTGATGQMKLYTLFEGASSSPTVWNLSVIGTGGTYLSTLAMGTPNVTSRSGSMLGRTFGDAYVGASTLVEDVFFWSPTQGLIQGVLSGSIGGFDTQTWSVFTKRIFTDQAVFSNTPTNCYSPQLGVDRGGELSLQMASYAEPDLPPHGASSFGSCSDYEGVTWYDTGTVVKNLGLPYLWAGLSRGGYFWTANARFGTNQGRQTEYTFGTTVRGDITISGFISASDFSWAITPDQKKVGIVYRTAGAPNRLIFVQYNVEADTLTIERAGTEFTGTYVVSLNAAVPQIAYNSVVGSWDIVASEDSRDGGQLVFYRRMENIVDPTLAWSGERVGNNGDKPLASMVAQAGKAPATPLVLSDGSLLVLTECGANFDALLTLRDLAGNWSTVHQTSSGGFEAPKLERTTGSSPVFWVLGGSSAGQAGVLRSDSATSGWTFAVTPNPTQTSGFSNYCRVRYPATQATVDGVRVACPLPAETGTSANRELGVFFLSNDGSIHGSAFAARGRLVSLSAQEESSYNFVSWTYKGDLLYRANRPSKPLAHWTIVRSKNGWKSLGESVVGSGRLLALQDRQYREEFVSVNQAETKIIAEFPSLVKKELLPLATRKEGELFGLKWQTSAYTGSLFGVMNDSTTTLETSLSSGALAIVNSRRWPRISGNTQGILSGGSVFGYGAGIRLSPPAGVTQSSYFGSATLPASGLFRLEALPALTFIGTHTFKNSDSNTSYTINGPVTFLLTTTGQHLVLEFCTQNSLVLDPNATGLSYWLDYEHPVDRFALVLGENRDTQFLLSRYFGGHLLTHGTYEPREFSAFDVRFENRRSYVAPIPYNFEQIPTGVSKRFKFKLEGTNHGIQSINIGSATLGQFVVRGPYGLGFQFLDFVTDRLRASATVIRPVITAHSSGDVIVLGD